MEVALRRNENKTVSIVVNGYGVAFISEATERMVVSRYWAEQVGIKDIQVKSRYTDKHI